MKKILALLIIAANLSLGAFNINVAEKARAAVASQTQPAVQIVTPPGQPRNWSPAQRANVMAQFAKKPVKDRTDQDIDILSQLLSITMPNQTAATIARLKQERDMALHPPVAPPLPESARIYLFAPPGITAKLVGLSGEGQQGWKGFIYPDNTVPFNLSQLTPNTQIATSIPGFTTKLVKKADFGLDPFNNFNPNTSVLRVTVQRKAGHTGNAATDFEWVA